MACPAEVTPEGKALLANEQDRLSTLRLAYQIDAVDRSRDETIDLEARGRP